MSDAITFSVTRERIDEGSALVVVTKFFRDGVATPPGSAWYRLDELRPGRRILDWTQIDVSAAPTAIPILITASQNLCRRHHGAIVTRQLTVVSGRGTSRQCVRIFRYEIASTLSHHAAGFLDDGSTGGDIPPVLQASRSGTSVTLTWTAAVPLAGTVSSYQIWKEDGPTLIATVDGNVLTHGVTQAEDTDVTYYVIAVTDIGGRLASNHAPATVGGPLPPVLDGSITGVDNTTASLTWSAGVTTGGPITGYKVYQDGSLIHTISNPATLSYDVTGLATDSEYHFNVTAITAQSESSLSNTLVLDTGHPLTIIDLYQLPGSYTWAKRAGLVSIDVIVIGAGGGGGGGRATAPGPDIQSSSGAGGGGYAACSIADPAQLSSSIPVVVGAGGIGGTGSVHGSGGGVGSSGADGGSSSFWQGQNGGNPASGVLGGGGLKGVCFSSTPVDGGNGELGSVSFSGAVTPTSIVTETGGTGGNSGGSNGGSTTRSGAGGAGAPGIFMGAPFPKGTPGAVSNPGPSPYTGSAGGEGGTSVGPNAGPNAVGGNGGTSVGPFYGGGGGGGGAVSVGSGDFGSSTAGNGGDGRSGVVVVINHLS